jgi:hypothetical protein
VLVPEVNLGQLSRLLRAEYLVDAISFTQVQGIPFRAAAMESAILQQIEGAGSQFAVEELDGSDGGSNDASNGADPSGANPNGAATDKRTSER